MVGQMSRFSTSIYKKNILRNVPVLDFQCESATTLCFKETIHL